MLRPKPKANKRFLILALLLTGAAASAQTFCGLVDDGTSVLVPSNYAGLPRPTKGGSYTQAFGGTNACQVQRVTDGITDTGQALTTHDYSTISPFNSDDSLLLVEKGSFQPYIVRRTDGGIVVPNAAMPSRNGNYVVWSTGNPRAFYYGSGANVMKGTITGTNCDAAHNWSGAPCTVTTSMLCSSSYSGLQINEQDISEDGLHLWMPNVAQDSGAVHIELITFNATDATSCTVTTDLSLSTYHKLGVLPNNMLYVNGGGDTVYNTDGTVFLSNISSQGGHVDFGRDIPSGKVVGVSLWNQGTAANGCSDQYGIGVKMFESGDPQLGTVIRCLDSCGGDYNLCHSLEGGLGVHYSFRDTTLGWVVSDESSDSTGCPSTTKYTCFNSTDPPINWDHHAEEILARKIDGSQTLRLAHHRSREGGGGGGNAYWGEPRSVISRDGKYIAFDSDFNVSTGDAAAGTVDVYVIPFQTASGAGTPAPPSNLAATVK